MSHQTSTSNDIGSTGITTLNFETNFVNLLVKKKISILSKLTSNPKKVQKAVENYMGIQSRHQADMGRMWFMRRMQEQHAYSHEIQVIAWKILQGYNWRQKKALDDKTARQCKSIVDTRIAMAQFNIKN